MIKIVIGICCLFLSSCAAEGPYKENKREEVKKYVIKCYSGGEVVFTLDVEQSFYSSGAIIGRNNGRDAFISTGNCFAVRKDLNEISRR